MLKGWIGRSGQSGGPLSPQCRQRAAPKGLPAGLAAQFAASFIKDEVDPSRTLIFGNLERCTIDMVNVLSVINRYVERHGCRVVVITHDEKIAEALTDRREKFSIRRYVHRRR